MAIPHVPERHASIGTSGWLRPFVLGAEDGIVSTAGLVIGVAAAGASADVLLAAGLAGLVSGSLSMAAGEYVSVAAQRDSELSDIERETWELENLPEAELEELAGIYQARGLGKELAMTVARHLTDHDALGTHLREELAIDQRTPARPWQAAWLSAVSFALGASMPLAAILLAPAGSRILVTVLATLTVLAGAGLVGAQLGRSRKLAGTLRVFAGGALAIAITWAVGSLVGAAL